jgi:hypothetical protein
MKRAIVAALTLVLATTTATSASAAEFTKIEATHNSGFGSLLVGVREQNIKPGARVRIVISAAERFKFQCTVATDQKYFIRDHLAIDFLEHANAQGRYRATFDVGPQLTLDVHLDRCEGDDYPAMIRSCYSAITALDVHREVGITWPDTECGEVGGPI